MNSTSRLSRAVSRGLTLGLGALTFIGVVGMSGCVREHLCKQYGIYESRIVELQMQPRLAQEDQPVPLAAEDAELVVKKLRTLPASMGTGSSGGSTMMQLLPLQR